MSREYEKRLQDFAQSNKDFEGEGVAELIVDTGESFATSVAKQASTPATSERIQNTRRDPIQADEDQAIEVAEDRALRRPSV